MDQPVTVIIYTYQPPGPFQHHLIGPRLYDSGLDLIACSLAQLSFYLGTPTNQAIRRIKLADLLSMAAAI
jgi:hypothetical protein